MIKQKTRVVMISIGLVLRVKSKMQEKGNDGAIYTVGISNTIAG
ncbi:hypothetical protein OH492_04100 [Vibrio chagasii]|nr:hypothetical protein [Vibrio chagasii]